MNNDHTITLTQAELEAVVSALARLGLSKASRHRDIANDLGPRLMGLMDRDAMQQFFMGELNDAFTSREVIQ